MQQSSAQLHSTCKVQDIYANLAADVETRFDTINYEVERPLHIWKNKIQIGLMEDDLDERVFYSETIEEEMKKVYSKT